MELLKPVRIFFFFALFLNFNLAYSQNIIPDTASQTTGFQNAVTLYHNSLIPETGLYNGSEYAYNLYYPFAINQGDPFFQTKQFDTGAVFYNNTVYKNVPLLYDLVKGELLTKDPTSVNIIRLNYDKVGWFNMYGQSFINIKRDSADNSDLHSGYYQVLYSGNASLYKKLSKIFKENTASAQGVNNYVAEVNEYFVKKDNQYYKIKNKKSLLNTFGERKKEVEQFMSKNKLSIKKHKDYAFTKAVAYYDSINNPKY